MLYFGDSYQRARGIRFTLLIWHVSCRYLEPIMLGFDEQHYKKIIIKSMAV